ncbi:phosphate uptake regulator, PhoU [Kytococcus aerolatus]|uniref:Phosphate-specific transport system accessory protein PhoU n=1 Tax=Kytococcus aerolatus TaxID=592308 RepID=A0A212U5V1_9MICO|nr:phosphate signaling complex protein PhoU [Kytococcus aerolatus]SNC73633.1 phosphate uptake regulator, PhoU [Kytococcus aerolatus]
MRTHFQQSLTEVSALLVEMSHLVAQAVAEASEALRTADGHRAEQVISGDSRIDAFQAEVEERAIELLARESPVARDLRMVVSALQLAASLERAGDLARHVAELARRRYPELAVPAPARATVTEMGQLAHTLVSQAGQALADQDIEAAARLAVLDDSLDALHVKVFTIAREELTDPGQAVDLTLLSRYFERIGDHAVSIGRRVEYLVSGTLHKQGAVEESHEVTVGGGQP